MAQPGADRAVAFAVEGSGRLVALPPPRPGWSYEVVNDVNCTVRLRGTAIVGAAALDWPAERRRLTDGLRIAPCDGAATLRGTVTLEAPGGARRDVPFRPGGRPQ